MKIYIKGTKNGIQEKRDFSQWLIERRRNRQGCINDKKKAEIHDEDQMYKQIDSIIRGIEGMTNIIRWWKRNCHCGE